MKEKLGSEERFRRLVELSPEPIVVHSGKELVFVNQASLNMFNITDPNEVLGKSILDFVPVYYHDLVKQRIGLMVEGGTAEPVEQQFIKPDGTLIDVEVSGVQLEFEGKPAIQLILRDITDKKKTRLELKESLQRYESLFMHNPDAVYSMDLDGKLKNVNPALVAMFDYSEEELNNMTFEPVIAPKDLPRTLEKFHKASSGEPQNYTITAVRKDGSTLQINVTNIPIVIEGEIIGVYGIAKDISKEIQIQRLLEENEEKYRSLFESNFDAVFEMDLNGRFKSVNKMAEEMTRFSKDELYTMAFPELNASDSIEVTKTFQQAIAGKAFLAEQKVRDKQGRLIDTDISVIPIRKSGQVDGVFSIVRDITEKKRTQEKIEQLAFIDQLTGLPNRHWFYEKLDQVIEHAKVHQRSVAILIIDFDEFKSVNDLLGHHGGDLFLQKVAEILKSCLRPNDSISRLGGDEFIVVLEDVTEVYVNRLADKILKVMNQPIQLMDHELIVTISIGISMGYGDLSDGKTFIRQADIAMYEAKERGKNIHLIFSQELSDKVDRKLQLEKALREAMDREELQLHYQPQIDIATGKLVGLEALLRWNSPFGPVSPAEFIPVAEETGMIVPIGEWVIKEACRQMVVWQQEGFPKVKVSVNVSARQFKDLYFSSKICSILTDFQIDPQYFCIEITESVMLNIEESSKLIAELQKFGIKIAIDDFGTGYSSLNAIMNIEIDMLKIDKSLIDEITGNVRNQAILMAIINIGKSLHTDVIVEGIETLQQVQVLEPFQVIGQGYYFSRPCPPEELGEMWRKA